MTKKSDAPAIRFKGFSDAWEQRKLEDYLTVSAEKNTGNIYGRSDVLSVSGDFGIVNQIEFQGRSFAGASVSNYGVVQTGDVVYTKSPLNSNPYGIIKTNKGKPGIVSTLYAVYHPKENAFSDFIQVYFEQHARMNNYMHPLVNKGAKNDMKVSAENALKGPVCFPSRIEQESISAFFSVLDNLITLHQRKFEKLTNVKKSMLEKMFPQNGSSYPEIRFKGFTDPWEQRKLGELVDRVVRKNTNNESTLPLTISAQYGLVDQITYFNNRVASRDVSNYYLVLNGEFAYNKSTSDGYPFGAVKRLDLYEKGVLSTLYIVFAPKKEQQIDSDYLTVFFDTDRWHKGVAERAAEGARNHGLLNISAEDFFDIDLSVPKDIVEQKQIGAFIRQLDNLITLHQRELEKLQNIKKSMLEKMFV
jgi:type I restriction enzyme S subunit